MMGHTAVSFCIKVNQVTKEKRKKVVTRRVNEGEHKTISLRLPIEVDEKLDRLAALTGKTRSRLVSETLISYAFLQLEGAKE